MGDDSKPSSPEADGSTTSAPTPPGAPASSPPTEDWSTRYKYLLADFENYRRRSDRDRESVSRQARGGMLRELLPIIEAFRAGRSSVEKLPVEDPVRRGVELLDREWSTFLKHEGVEPVVKVGSPFRPDEAEAVGETIVPAATTDGAVVEVVQQGYRFFGGLLRPAKVIVGRHAPPPTEASELVTEKSE